MFERLKVALQSRVNSGELRSSCPRGRAAGTLSDAQEVLRRADGSVTLNRQSGGGIGLRNDPLIKSEGPFPQNTFPKLNGEFAEASPWRARRESLPGEIRRNGRSARVRISDVF